MQDECRSLLAVLQANISLEGKQWCVVTVLQSKLQNNRASFYRVPLACLTAMLSTAEPQNINPILKRAYQLFLVL